MQHTEEGRRGLTISTGELPSSFDPVISEWGNPLVLRTRTVNKINKLTN